MRGLFKGLSFWMAIAAAGSAQAASPPDYRLTTGGGAQVTGVIDLASKTKTGDVIRVNLHLLRKRPIAVGDIQAVWTDGVEEVDCARRRSRTMLTANLNIDRTRRAASPSAGFQPWTANAPDSDGGRLEAFLCRNSTDARFIRVASLSAEQQPDGEIWLADKHVQFLERASRDFKTLAKDDEPARFAPPLGARHYLQTDVGLTGATLIDPASVNRQGDKAMVDELWALPGVQAYQGRDYPWAEVATEFDCLGHRSRRISAKFMSADRKQHTPYPDGKSDWEPDARGTDDRNIEEFVCGRITAQRTQFKPVDDIDRFRTEMLAAIKAGAFKE